MDYLDIKSVPVQLQNLVSSFTGKRFSIVRTEDFNLEAEIKLSVARLLERKGNQQEIKDYLDQIAAIGNLEAGNFLKALWARVSVASLETESEKEPRKEYWDRLRISLEAKVAAFDASSWNWLKSRISSLNKAGFSTLLEKLKSYQNLHKGERMQLIFIQLLEREAGANASETYKQLLEIMLEVETIFVPWQIVLENQIRNSHEDILDPIKLAQQYRNDALTVAIADVKAEVDPSLRDQFYRGIMKPPSPTACRKNLYLDKIIYGLTGHVVVIDDRNGSIVAHNTPPNGGFAWWFNKDFFRQLPNDKPVFSRAGIDQLDVWDEYEFNENAELLLKSS